MPFVWSAVSGFRLQPEVQPPECVWVCFEGFPQTGIVTDFSGRKTTENDGGAETVGPGTQASAPNLINARK